MEHLFNRLSSNYKDTAFQSIILLLPITCHGDHPAIFENIWETVKNHLKPSGTLWILVNDPYLPAARKKIPHAYQVCKELQDNGFSVKNIIICPNPSGRSFILAQYYSSLLFAALDPLNYEFNKDLIREQHIWKDFEWGGGRRSRYNPLGKDPSNLWISTESEKGTILKYRFFDHQDLVERILTASTGRWNEALVIKEAGIDLSFLLAGKHAQPAIISLDLPPVTTSSDPVYPLAHPGDRPVPVKATVKVYYHTCEDMSEIADSSAQCVVTSPPYWGLRDYDHPDQIGHDEDYRTYRDRLKKVWRECHRILTPSGTLWVNINKRIIQGNLLNIPHDFIEDISSCGFDLQDIVIWHKPVAVPTFGENNLMDRWETILFFSKQQQECYINTGYSISPPDYLGEVVKPVPNCWRFHRKIGNIGKAVKAMINEKEIKHTAVFPGELVNRVVRLSTREGDLVVDPFAGSGTTLKQALDLRRSAIGYEINPDYKAIIDFRLTEASKRLTDYFS